MTPSVPRDLGSPIQHSVLDELLAVLSERLGAAHVMTASGDIAPYLVEDRGLYRGHTPAVVRPETVEDVAFVVRECHARRVPIVPQGGNTGLCGGGVPLGGIVLAMGRLNRVREVDPVNSTMTVEAGCILKTIQEKADEVNRLFPLSLAAEGSCQIGGNLSTNAGGTAVLRYGNARDLVLGIEVVLPDGRILNALAGLRKDNTGYDLKNLFIGAEGTLGIITAAVLKLYPKPCARATAFVGCASPHAALKLFDYMRAVAGDSLTAFEYLPHFALETVLKHTSGAVAPFDAAYHSYALLELSASDPQMDLQARLTAALGHAMEDGVIEDAVIGRSEAQNQALWLLRESMSESQKFEGGSIKHDVSVPVSKVAEFIERASIACEREMAGLRVCAFGHFGDGNIHFNLSQPVGMDKQAFLAHWDHFNHIVHDIVVEMGGSISAEHGVGLVKLDALPRYKDPVALDLMRTIKHAIDPLGLMNPGKVVPPVPNPDESEP